MKSDNLKLIGLLRNVMDDATTKIQLSRDISDIPAAMVKRLCFSKREDWMVFGSCLYTFEDAEMAIRGYFDTAESRHSRDFEYLRLFGFLNAVYLQLGAIDRLCGIVGVDGKKSVIRDLRAHELIRCRNMLASHTVAYMSKGAIQSITIEQISLGGTGATFMVNETDERKYANFKELYASWVCQTRDALGAVIRKFIEIIYSTSAEKKSDYLGRLDGLIDSKGQLGRMGNWFAHADWSLFHLPLEMI